MRRLGVFALLAACSAGLLADGQRALTPASTFIDILREYTTGDPRYAVETLSEWKEARLNKDAVLPAGTTGLVYKAAAALLLTEAGMASRRFGRPAEGASRFAELRGWGLQKFFEVHSYRSHELIDGLAEQARATDDAELLSWVKSWYILTTSYCLEFQLHCTEGLLEKGLHHADKNDPEVMLWRGSVREPRIKTPAVYKHQMPRSVLHGQEARYWYRKALGKRPNLVEARMRLGRSLYVTQNDPDAAGYLESALEQAESERHVFAGYMAALTLGEIREAADDLEGAVPYYRRAVAMLRGHTASIALGLALIRSGQRDEGGEQGRLMFGTRGPGPESVMDPYAVYLSAQYWQSASRLDEMRKAVRGGRR